jgi:hypothetical protein
MDGAPRLMSMTNVHALSRYRALREQQACRLMQADAAARDRAREASEAAAAALAHAENDRSQSERRHYRDLASTASVTIEMLYRGHDELARLAEAVAGANRLAEAASANLVHCEQALLRSAAEHRARSREVRKSHLVRDKLESAIRSHMELIDELDAEEQGSIRHAKNKPGGRSERP